MNDIETELFEQELRRQRPAPAPEELLQKLCRIEPKGTVEPKPTTWWSGFAVLLHAPWLRAGMAGVAVLIVGLLLLSLRQPLGENSDMGRASVAVPPQIEATAVLAVPPDEVEIDRRLIASYVAIAELPNQGPVRFRCEEWHDRVTVRDPISGVDIERLTPRYEIVPVSFEVY